MRVSHVADPHLIPVLALLYYDYSLTLADERKLIWSRTLGITTVLYVLCRYALAANLIYLLAIAHLIDEVRDDLDGLFHTHLHWQYALPSFLVGWVLIFRIAAMPRTLVSRRSVSSEEQRF